MGEELKKVKSKPPKTSDFDILHLSEHLDLLAVWFVLRQEDFLFII